MKAQKNKKTTSSETDRSLAPVAPASGRVLGGVVLFSVVGLYGSAQLPSDVLAIVGCIVTLTAGAVTLDITGRKRAAEHPHPLYVPGRLPSDSPKLKLFAMVLTLMMLVAVISITVSPTKTPSPFPFFMAAGWIILVLPQLLARRALRRFDSIQGIADDRAPTNVGSGPSLAAKGKSRKGDQRK